MNKILLTVSLFALGAVGLLNLAISIVNNLKLNKMANDNAQKFEQVLNEIDLGTNEVAAELESLRGAIKDLGLSSAQEEQILGKLTEQAARLRSMGKSESPAGTTGGTGDLGGGDTTGGEGGPTV
jgi:hypothetical protein